MNLDISISKILLSIVLILLVRFIIKRIKNRVLVRGHQKAIAQRLHERDETLNRQIAKLENVSNDLKQLILNSDVNSLLKHLNSGTITSVQILSVYFERAATIGKDLCLITESNYDQALEMARKCDEIRNKTPLEKRSSLGLLYGIPISVKECIAQKGYDCTMGYASNLNKPYNFDAASVVLLQDQGAIPFIRSNLPQGLMAFESHNHIWGRAKNPWNQDRIVGGSSGGEAGLIASKCSPIGLATDSLGSIRIPASCCGLYAFKPTNSRVSVAGFGFLNSFMNAKRLTIRNAFGPIGRTVSDCMIFFRSMLSPRLRELDPHIPYIPFDESKSEIKGKLRVGVWRSCDVFPVCKSVERGINLTIQALKDEGHEIVEINIPKAKNIIQLVSQIMMSEGNGRAVDEVLQGEPIVPVNRSSYVVAKIPNFAKNILAWILNKRGEKRLSIGLKNSKKMSAFEFFHTVNSIETIRMEFFDLWKEKSLDCLISPSWGIPAAAHDKSDLLKHTIIYQVLANVMNLAAGIVPVTKVQNNEQNYEDHINGNDKVAKAASECMKNSEGLPITVQVLTLPFEDEKCLGIMKVIEKNIDFHELPKIQGEAQCFFTKSIRQLFQLSLNNFQIFF